MLKVATSEKPMEKIEKFNLQNLQKSSNKVMLKVYMKKIAQGKYVKSGLISYSIFVFGLFFLWEKQESTVI